VKCTYYLGQRAMPDPWMDGYQWGYLHGLEEGRVQGWAAADEHAAAIHARAYQIVQAHAKIDSHQTVAGRVHHGEVTPSGDWPEPSPAGSKSGQEEQVTRAPSGPPPSSRPAFAPSATETTKFGEEPW
jgi:hypothetical protein